VQPDADVTRVQVEVVGFDGDATPGAIAVSGAPAARCLTPRPAGRECAAPDGPRLA
jgi:hypothetical protein